MDVKDELQATLKQSKKFQDLSNRREAELQKTISAMQRRIDELEGVISGLNLDGVHKRYKRVLKIVQEKRCSLAEAMRQYGVPRNTLRDCIGICELFIVDEEKYERVLGCERDKSWKVSVKQIEMCCRETLKEYRAQSKRLKEEGKLLPFYPGEEFYTRK
ncbi:hypothetical protein OS493_017463 [Desmophyllum pertusum]|uniref:Uncharacterized protein n=1 Tax=Desmophyllum pertusum TaxID=174260 RepID=A0A9W9ZNZ1_9CNID|nr:hypothetical protein OS493_017463 [Desmophyllum pertusum]